MANHFVSNPEEERKHLAKPTASTKRSSHMKSHNHPYAAPATSSASFAKTRMKQPNSTVRTQQTVGAKTVQPVNSRRSSQPQGNQSNKNKLGDLVSKILFIVGILLLVIGVGLFIFHQWEYKQQDQINEKLASFSKVDADGLHAPEVDWAALKKVNSEVVGWIQIPQTVVNFPVYQADNNEKYLHTSAEGQQSLGGQIFMDYENNKQGLIDNQTIIYGHHLRNGAMFKPVVDMTNQEMFDSVSTVWYSTPTQNYELEPLLIYETLDTDETVRQFNFSSEQKLHEYLSKKLQIANAKRADAADVIAKTKHVLALCTCNYNNGDAGRTILLCVPKNE